MRLLTCFLVILAVAIQRDGRILGHDLHGDAGQEEAQPMASTFHGTTVISTDELAKDIKGYGGSTPLKITLADGKITQIEALRNAETPEFFERVRTELIPKWIGTTVDEGLTKQVDAVSGATLSSNAVNETIRRALQEVAETPTATATSSAFTFSWKWIATLLVVLAGAIVPLFYKGKRYRVVQLALNVLVVGLWSGTFVSYSLMVNYLSGGVSILPSLISLLLLAVVFVYPLFGKPGHYCAWNCPLGSLQELAGRCCKRKWVLSAKALQRLETFRDALWAVLMLMMWTGISFAWMNYELFTAFLFNQASWAVIVVALLFVALSLFVQRPFCRFVCPVGTLFKLNQNTK
jgi:hypothetical protein